MKLNIIDTGSKANCFVIEHNDKFLVLDGGSRVKDIMQVVKKPSAISIALITHEHNDHSNAVEELLRRGVTLYRPKPLVTPQVNIRPRTEHYVEIGMLYQEDNIKFKAFEAIHDVPNVGYFIKIDNKKIVYVTDTAYIKQKFKEVNVLIAECNYMSEDLINADINPMLRSRIAMSHLSVENLAMYIESMNKTKLKHIILTHISETRGYNRKMLGMIQNAAGSKVKVHIGTKGDKYTI